MNVFFVTLLGAAIIAVACGDGGGIDENGPAAATASAAACKPESDAPARAEAETFTTNGGVEVVVVTGAPAANPAQANDQIAVNFKGSLQDGTQFGDSQEQLGRPFEFGINTDNVICGWVEGIVGMSPGEVRMLTIPPELAYGNGGFGDLIPADATVVFEVEMVEFVPPVPVE